MTDITAANRFNYFAVAASQSSTQSGGGWDDVDPNPPVTQVLEEKEGQRLSPGVVVQVPSKKGTEKEEKEGRGRRMLVKMILCLGLLNLPIENRRSLGQR